jgi:hypothetical protein
VVGEAFDFAEDEDLAMFMGEGGEGVGEVEGVLSALGGVVCGSGAGVEGVGGVCIACGAFSVEIGGAPEEDADEPGARGGVVAELVERLEGGHQRILNEVFGVFGRGDE